MLFEFDKTQSIRYQQGHEDGFIKAMEIMNNKYKIGCIERMAAYGCDNKMIADVLRYRPKYIKTVLKQLKKREKINQELNISDANILQIAEGLNVLPIIVAYIRDEMEQ